MTRANPNLNNPNSNNASSSGGNPMQALLEALVHQEEAQARRDKQWDGAQARHDEQRDLE